MKNRVHFSAVPSLPSYPTWSSLIIVSTFFSDRCRMLLVSLNFGLYGLTSFRIQEGAIFLFPYPISSCFVLFFPSSLVSQSKDSKHCKGEVFLLLNQFEVFILFQVCSCWFLIAIVTNYFKLGFLK